MYWNVFRAQNTEVYINLKKTRKCFDPRNRNDRREWEGEEKDGEKARPVEWVFNQCIPDNGVPVGHQPVSAALLPSSAALNVNCACSHPLMRPRGYGLKIRRYIACANSNGEVRLSLITRIRACGGGKSGGAKEDRDGESGYEIHALIIFGNERLL